MCVMSGEFLCWKQRDVGYYADGVNNFTLGKIIIEVTATVRVWWYVADDCAVRRILFLEVNNVHFCQKVKLFIHTLTRVMQREREKSIKKRTIG